MNAADNVMLDRIYDFVYEKVSSRATLSPSTRLFSDLGVDGDDAYEFMAVFSEVFHVSPGDFTFCRYFGGEGFNPLILFLNLFRRRPRKVELTLAMLVRAARQGCWITEIVEAESNGIETEGDREDLRLFAAETKKPR